MSQSAELLMGMIYWRGRPGEPGMSKLWNPIAERELRKLATKLISGGYKA